MTKKTIENILLYFSILKESTPIVRCNWFKDPNMKALSRSFTDVEETNHIVTKIFLNEKTHEECLQDGNMFNDNNCYHQLPIGEDCVGEIFTANVYLTNILNDGEILFLSDIIETDENDELSISFNKKYYKPFSISKLFVVNLLEKVDNLNLLRCLCAEKL